MLFLLKVFLDRSLHPDDTSEEDEGEWREDHQVVRNISDAAEDIAEEAAEKVEEAAETVGEKLGE